MPCSRASSAASVQLHDLQSRLLFSTLAVSFQNAIYVASQQSDARRRFRRNRRLHHAGYRNSGVLRRRDGRPDAGRRRGFRGLVGIRANRPPRSQAGWAARHQPPIALFSFGNYLRSVPQDMMREPSTLNLLKADAEVAAALAPERLEEMFDLGYHFEHVDTIFARVFA